MQLAVNKQDGSEAGTSVEVADAAFGAAFNEPLVHQAVVGYLAGARAGTRAQKTRAQVRGGGAKPWRQKGTGRARAGSIRSPIWRSGGATFAAQPQDHAVKLNRKMYRGALRAVLSELVRQERVVVVEDFDVEAPKTRELVAKLGKLGLSDVLVVVEAPSENLELAARNLHWVDVRSSSGADLVSLIAFEKVLVTVGALKQLEGRVQ